MFNLHFDFTFYFIAAKKTSLFKMAFPYCFAFLEIGQPALTKREKMCIILNKE